MPLKTYLMYLHFLMAIHFRYKLKRHSTRDRMELGFFPKDFSLDELEIPRDKVVLYQTTGEGAFGTVYEGEAYLDNELWVTVAVKTLKNISSVEEKVCTAIMYTLLSRLAKREDSLLSCASDFLPITVFVSISRIN